MIFDYWLFNKLNEVLLVTKSKKKISSLEIQATNGPGSLKKWEKSREEKSKEEEKNII